MRKQLFSILFLCTSCIAQAYQLNTTFDSLFPMTWYQKGLEASLLVWQKLIHYAENNINPQSSTNELLGLLAQTLFCVDRMKQEGVVCMPEDKDYFVMVLSKIKDLIGAIVMMPENEDFVMCAQWMVLNIQEQI